MIFLNSIAFFFLLICSGMLSAVNVQKLQKLQLKLAIFVFWGHVRSPKKSKNLHKHISHETKFMSGEFCECTSSFYCNVGQGALQKFLKLSIKNSKSAVSNKHIQDGRPGRYENRRGSKVKAKPRPPPPPRSVNVRDVITQKARESGIVPSYSKKTVFRQKNAK